MVTLMTIADVVKIFPLESGLSAKKSNSSVRNDFKCKFQFIHESIGELRDRERKTWNDLIRIKKELKLASLKAEGSRSRSTERMMIDGFIKWICAN
jgi:hypothetical protein